MPINSGDDRVGLWWDPYYRELLGPYLGWEDIHAHSQGMVSHNRMCVTQQDVLETLGHKVCPNHNNLSMWPWLPLCPLDLKFFKGRHHICLVFYLSPAPWGSQRHIWERDFLAILFIISIGCKQTQCLSKNVIMASFLCFWLRAYPFHGWDVSPLQ